VSANGPQPNRTIFDEDEDLFHFDELREDQEQSTPKEMDVEAFLAAADSGAAAAPVAEPEPAARGKSRRRKRRGADEAATADDPELALPEEALASAAPTSADIDRVLRAAARAAVRTPPWVKLGGAALLLVNLMALLVVFQNQRTDALRMAEAQRELEETAKNLRDDVGRQVEQIRGVTAPILIPAGAEAGTFERVQRALDEGDLPGARRQLYATLAIADKLPEPERGNLEAEANFLLADTYRLEAAASEVPR
jgi:hypothetical protein